MSRFARDSGLAPASSKAAPAQPVPFAECLYFSPNILDTFKMVLLNIIAQRDYLPARVGDAVDYESSLVSLSDQTGGFQTGQVIRELRIRNLHDRFQRTDA